MNELQKVISEIIFEIVNIDKIFKFGDSTKYGIKNYIARYSLASNEYFISIKARELFEKNNISNPLTRSSIDKKIFIYEHAIPANIILENIEKSDRKKETIFNILKISDCVTILTKEEDKILSYKYRSKMPENWSLSTDDVFQRYYDTNIKISEKKWKVKGNLKR